MRSRLESLDGVRAIAILGVLTFHAFTDRVPGGHLGVTVFFVLSGYLITTLLCFEHGRDGRIDFRRFYLRRAARLLPALCSVVLISAVFYVVHGEYPSRDVAIGAVATLFYATNILAGYVSVGSVHPFLWAWSLSLEEQFYLLWPALLLLAATRRRLAWLIAAATAAAALAEVLRIVLKYHGGEPPRIYFAPDARMDAILVGCVLALLLQQERLVSAVRGYAAPMGFLGLVLILLAFDEAGVAKRVTYTVWSPVIDFASAAVIASLVCDHKGMVARCFSWRPAVLLGRISYGAYLWNVLALDVVAAALPHSPGRVRGALTIALTLGAAALSYVWLEQPILRRIRSQPRPIELR